MLENSFYTVKENESGENSFRITVELNPSHEIYKAHFPENPITPGVCLLQMSLELLNTCFERDLRLIEAKNIKYLKIINPLENPKIDFNINYRTERDLIFAEINIMYRDILFTKVSATYKGL
jgi:3-hydroxyacyl-[acyl-carrier-protein] dehydratase